MKKLIAVAVSTALAISLTVLCAGNTNAEAYTIEAIKLDAPTTMQRISPEIMLPDRYNSLSEQAQNCYLDIRKAIIAHKNSTKISSRISEKTLIEIADILNSQDPLVFDEATIEFREVGSDNSYARLTYPYSKAVEESMLMQTVKASEKIIAAFAPDSDEKAKLTNIHDSIVSLTELDNNATFPSSAYGTIVIGKGNSEGFARAFQFISLKAGITSIVISGTDVNGNEHFWNKIKCDGKWYNIDCSQGKASDENKLFMVSDDTISEYYKENSDKDYPATDNNTKHQ